MEKFKIVTTGDWKRTISQWDLDEHNVWYEPRQEHVTHIEDVSTDDEQRFIIKLDSGAERLITQADIDKHVLTFCKYNEHIKKLERKL